MLKVTSLVLIMLSTVCAISQGSNIQKLVKRLENRGTRISELERQLSSKILQLKAAEKKYADKASLNYREISNLKKEIENRTQEIYNLHATLKDLMVENNKLKEELAVTKEYNNYYKKSIDALNRENTTLTRLLNQYESKITELTDALEEANLEKQIKDAKIKALEDRIEYILNYRKEMYFFEFQAHIPLGYAVEFAYTPLLKVENLAIGPYTSYKYFYKDYDLSGLVNSEHALITVGGMVRIPITERKFSYLNNDKSQSWVKRNKHILSIQMGYSSLLNQEINPIYSGGGIHSSLTFGSIWSSLEKANIFINSGFDLQIFKYKNPEKFLGKNVFTVRLGMGISF